MTQFSQQAWVCLQPFDQPDGIQQIAIAKRLDQASTRKGAAIYRRGGSGQQHRDIARAGVPGNIKPATVVSQPHIGDHQINLALRDKDQCVSHIINRANHLIAFIKQNGFMIKRDQRLIFDNENALDVLSFAFENHGLADPCCAIPMAQRAKLDLDHAFFGDQTIEAVMPDHAASKRPRHAHQPSQKRPAQKKPAETRADAGEHRIAKLLARAGIASRREIERMIAEGRVALNGTLIETPATILSSLAGITVDGKPVRAAEPTRLIAFHKPTGLITAERDPAGRPTIYSALANALPAGMPRLMPIGRLDLNTEGLLLMTNDGGLKRAMELPASGIQRSYRARTFGNISQPQLEALIDGITIDGIRYGRIDANMERRTGRNQWIELTISEGKNREIRRILEHLGLEVSRLIRTRYGPFELGEIPRGAVAEFSAKQVERFTKTLK